MAARQTSQSTNGGADEVLLEMDSLNDNNLHGSPLGLYFEPDGYKIDYILVYEKNKEREKDEELRKKAEELEKNRVAFEKKLDDEGMMIERVKFDSPQDPQKTRHFVMLHLPWKTLSEKAEEMKLKSPIQECDVKIPSWMENKIGKERMDKLWSHNPLVVHDSVIEEKKSFFMANFERKNLSKYHFHEQLNEMFTTTDRQLVVQRMCCSARFAEGPEGVGLKQLLYKGAYIAKFPLHDGDVNVKEGKAPTNDRQRLKQDWARFGRCFKYQPYNAIKDYFGTETGLYFAWLGFYTAMLVPLAIAGLIVFIYGIASAPSNPVVKDSCDKKLEGYFYMCPMCDRQCSYWDLLQTTCVYAYVTHFFDNDGTVALAIISSIWATLFLEFWKRRQASLANEWHVANFEREEEPMRPEFAAIKPQLKENPATGIREPYIPKMTLYQRYGTIGSIIAMMILLVIAAVIGVVVYRAAVFTALSGHTTLTIRSRARTITSMTAALINLLCISLLKFVYNKLAVWLTNWENPRTRTDYKNSFTYKMYLFQFVNTYSSIFYIAFFKAGLFIGTPGRYKRIAGKYRLEGCSAQGCFLELCVQLFIIMVGLQIIAHVTEIAIPAFKYWQKMRKDSKNQELSQYEQDFDLSDHDGHFMFWEYLETVLQFGFVTMFVAAFPLAPLFSLLNAIVQIRVDAINFVSQYRRRDTAMAEDIGAWYRILEVLLTVSILVNAFVLSFTSSFIPRLLYKMKYAPDRDSGGTLKGYLNASLSFFEVKYFDVWEPGTKPEDPYQNLNYSRSVCRYAGYHDNTPPFEFSKQYWHVIAARLAFVFVFHFMVYSLTGLVAWAIPDQSHFIDLKVKREKHLAEKLHSKKTK